LRRRPDEPTDGALVKFYRSLLGVLSHPLFHEGTWRACGCDGWPDNSSFEHLIAWQWSLGNEECLVIINYSGQTVQGFVHTEGAGQPGRQFLLQDPINDQRFHRSSSEICQLFVELAPWQFHCFFILPA
jgi:hypothetical protein